jgi:hypothetical protein
MTNLRDEMDDAFASMHVDLDRLGAHAAAEGGRLRRRNRLAVLGGGTLALLVVVGLGVWTTSVLVAPEKGRTSLTAGPVALGLLTGTEALTVTLARVAPAGVVSRISEMTHEPARGGSTNAYGSVRFAPSVDAASSEVMVSYQRARGEDLERNSRCQPQLPDCQISALPDGSVVLTYAISQVRYLPGLEGSGWAAHRVVDGTVVALAATAPDQHADPVLSRDQLLTLISQPEWSRLTALPPAT